MAAFFMGVLPAGALRLPALHTRLTSDKQCVRRVSVAHPPFRHLAIPQTSPLSLTLSFNLRVKGIAQPVA